MSFRADKRARVSGQAAVALAVLTICHGCFGINPVYNGGTSAGTAATETDVAATTETTTDTASEGPAGSQTDTGADAETTNATQPVSVLPELAECVGLETDKHDYVGPDACEQAASQGNNNMGIGEMVVDGLDNDLNDTEVRTYLKFPWNPAYTASGASVELILHTTQGEGESSDQTGVVWKVEAFDLENLEQGASAKIGQEFIAPDQGMAGNNSAIVWAIPASAFTEGEPLYLGVFPVTNDGVNYWNLDAKDADERPALVVHVN